MALRDDPYKDKFKKLTDSELISLGLAQNEAALKILLVRHTRALRSVLLSLGVPGHEIDDFCQDTFLSALENLGDYKGSGNFLSWLTTIATRLYWRKLRRDKRTILSDDPHSLSTEEPAADLPLTNRMDMMGALNSLRPEVRLCLILFLTHDWSHSQIANHLDIPLGTTKSHILRGIKLLKLKLNPTDLQKPQPSYKELESEKTL
jgi:RNA polymerase sigma-70 factor (ECF subfamily)